MKHYVISQHESYEYEGTNSVPVAIRHCDELDVIAEVAILNANVTTADDDLVTHYYTYHEIPLAGFGTEFDLPSKKAEYNLVSLRNRMEFDIERAHVFYNHGKENIFCSRHDTFKSYFLEDHRCRERSVGIPQEQVEDLFDEIFANYVKRGIRLE